MLPVAILAGGLGTRLGPITNSLPKSMIEICGQPFLHWQIKHLVKAGISNVICCVAYKSEMIKSFLGDGSQYGIEVKYSEDGPRQLGTGGAIVNALPLLGSDFMVLYGDSFLPINYSHVASKFLEGKKPALMTVYENLGRYDSSNVEFGEGVLRCYQKNGKGSRFTHIDYGLSCFRKSVFSNYSSNLPLDLSDVCNELSSKNLLDGYEVFQRFYEVGSHQGINDFVEYVKIHLNDMKA